MALHDKAGCFLKMVKCPDRLSNLQDLLRCFSQFKILYVFMYMYLGKGKAAKANSCEMHFVTAGILCMFQVW